MRLVPEDLVRSEFQCSLARPNARNHLSAATVALDEDVSRVSENLLRLVHHRSELVAGDPVAPDPERAELPGRPQHQIGGGHRQRPEVNLRRRRWQVRLRQVELRQLQRLLEELAEDLIRGGARASRGRDRRRWRHRNLAVAARERHFDGENRDDVVFRTLKRMNSDTDE